MGFAQLYQQVSREGPVRFGGVVVELILLDPLVFVCHRLVEFVERHNDAPLVVLVVEEQFDGMHLVPSHQRCPVGNLDLAQLVPPEPFALYEAVAGQEVGGVADELGQHRHSQGRSVQAVPHPASVFSVEPGDALLFGNVAHGCVSVVPRLVPESGHRSVSFLR